MRIDLGLESGDMSVDKHYYIDAITLIISVSYTHLTLPTKA